MTCFACADIDGANEKLRRNEKLLYSNAEYVKLCNVCSTKLGRGRVFSIAIDDDPHTRLMFRVILGRLHFAITKTN